jgi:hypothetical protein
MRLGAGDENVININEDVGGALRRVKDEQGGVRPRSDKTKFQETITKAREPSMRACLRP